MLATGEGLLRSVEALHAQLLSGVLGRGFRCGEGIEDAKELISTLEDLNAGHIKGWVKPSEIRTPSERGRGLPQAMDGEYQPAGVPALTVRRGETAFAATLFVAETFLLIQLESESHRRKANSVAILRRNFVITQCCCIVLQPYLGR